MRRQIIHKYTPPTFGALRGSAAERLKRMLEKTETLSLPRYRLVMTPHLMEGEVEVRGTTILIGVNSD